MKFILILLCILFATMVSAQSNLKTKPAQVVKLTWDASTEPDVYEYAIFWCQGADTTLFPFNTGTNPDSLWMNEPISSWSFARVYDRKYLFETRLMNGVSYLRMGVAGINRAGQMGLIQCIPKVIRVVRPIAIENVKVE